MTDGRRLERERFPGREESVSLGHRRSKVTWENGSEHSGSLWFADTEEVTGSNPVAPTNNTLTSRNAGQTAVRLPPIGEESVLPFGMRSAGWNLLHRVTDRLTSTFGDWLPFTGGREGAHSGRRTLPCP